MKTEIGEIAVSDAHAHFFSWSFFEALGKQIEGHDGQRPAQAALEKLGWDPPPRDNTALAVRWVQELDQHGVDKIALMASLPGEEGAVADAVRAFPDRIHGYFMLNPLAPDAVERAGRALDTLGLRGICLFPAMHRFSVQDERLNPIYELASERKGVVVFVHSGVLTVGVRKKLGLPSRFDMSLSNPIDLHRVALEFPKANFVIPHFGAGYFREVLMLGDLVPNVYLDTSSSNSWTKYQTPPVSLEAVFAQAREIYGAERLLFGSDSSFFPRGWNRQIFETQFPILRKIGLELGELRSVFAGNLEKLLAGR